MPRYEMFDKRTNATLAQFEIDDLSNIGFTQFIELTSREGFDVDAFVAEQVRQIEEQHHV